MCPLGSVPPGPHPGPAGTRGDIQAVTLAYYKMKPCDGFDDALSLLAPMPPTTDDRTRVRRAQAGDASGPARSRGPTTGPCAPVYNWT